MVDGPDGHHGARALVPVDLLQPMSVREPAPTPHQHMAVMTVRAPQHKHKTASYQTAPQVSVTK